MLHACAVGARANRRNRHLVLVDLATFKLTFQAKHVLRMQKQKHFFLPEHTYSNPARGDPAMESANAAQFVCGAQVFAVAKHHLSPKAFCNLSGRVFFVGKET